MDLAWMTLLVSAYLLGSFPSAYLAGRLLRGVDIRELGDGNPGAANAYRELGPLPGILVGLADIGKGVGSVALAGQLVGSPQAAMLAGATSVAGHNWPFYLQFRGGRGASTSLGVLAILMPLAIGILALLAVIVACLARSITIGSGVLYGPLWLVALLTSAPAYLVAYSVALPTLVGVAHFLSLRRAPERLSREAPQSET